MSSSGSGVRIRELLSKYNTVVVVMVIFAFFSLVTPNFLRPSNLLTVLRQVSVNGIIATGMTLVILVGGIDLSVGAVAAVASVLAAKIANEANLMWWVSLPAAVGAAALFGLITGIFVAYFKLAPFIMTLAMMTIARGLALVLSSGKPISGMHKSFSVFGQSNILGIPIPAWVLAVVVLVTVVLLRYVRFGRYIYAVGGNEQAAKNSGINTKAVKLVVYVICGLFTGIASMVLTSRLMGGLPQVASGYELDAIAAVVIGGTSLYGGTGGILGTVIGVLIIGFINNGMDLMNIASYPQQIIKGVIIILAVFIDSLRNKGEA